MFAVVFFVLASLGAIVHLARDWQPRTRARVVEVSLMWWLGLGLGGGSLFGAMGHLFFADRVAESIGWATGSPFQREVGFANLALGTIAVMAVRKRAGFREAAVIAVSIFLLGAAVGHVIEVVDAGNTAEYNSGPILYTDIIGPLVAIGLLLASQREQRSRPAVEGVVEEAWS